MTHKVIPNDKRETCGKVYVSKDLIDHDVVVIPREEFGILFNCEKCGFEQTIDLDFYFKEYLS